MSESHIGPRLRTARREQGRSQAAIAGLCGIAVDYLSQIERGKKIPSLDVLQALSRELGVPLSHLLEDAPEPAPSSSPTIDPAVARALLGYGGSPRAGGASPTPAALRDRVESAWETWQTSGDRFTDVAPVLPALILDIETALRFYRSPGESSERREVLRSAADLYGLLRSYTRRSGRTDLSLMVADRSLRAAEEADDPIRVATAHWNLGHILLGDNQPGAADDVAQEGVRQLKKAPASRDTVAMTGALELVSVVGLARRRQWWKARHKLLDDAQPLADKAGEGNVGRTVFGPTNVALHQLSIEMEAGEAGEALRVSDDIDTRHLPSLERRFTFALDVARCYDQRDEYPAVLIHLLDMETDAPQDLARTPVALAMVDRLVEKARPTYRKQALALGERLRQGKPTHPS